MDTNIIGNVFRIIIPFYRAYVYIDGFVKITKILCDRYDIKLYDHLQNLLHNVNVIFKCVLFIFYPMYRLVSIKEPTDLYADYLVYYIPTSRGTMVFLLIMLWYLTSYLLKLGLDIKSTALYTVIFYLAAISYSRG